MRFVGLNNNAKVDLATQNAVQHVVLNAVAQDNLQAGLSQCVRRRG